MTLRYMRYLATGLVTILLLLPALSVELFRYRGAAKDGGTLEYVFQAGEQNSPDAVTKEKAAEIAAALEGSITKRLFRFLDKRNRRLICAISVVARFDAFILIGRVNPIFSHANASKSKVSLA